MDIVSNELSNKKRMIKQYYRFGDIPKDNKSSIWSGNKVIGYEEGVSVYECHINEEGILVPVIPFPVTEYALNDYMYHLQYFRGRRYLVTGIRIGTGSNGEPLIIPETCVEIVDNKIME